MADLHVLEDTPAQPQAKFYSGGVLTDLDGAAGGTCTVTLTRPDGSAGPASGTVTHVSTGVYSFVLNAQPDPTLFTVTWAGTIGGKAVSVRTRIEIVGDFLFTTAEAKAFRVANATPLATVADADLMETRAAITDEFEAICGWSFVGRYRRDLFDGPLDQLVLDRLKIQRIISVTVDGTAYTAPELADLIFTPAGTLRRRTLGWFSSAYSAAIAVEYVHGWDRVPGAIKQAALKLCAAKLNPSALGSSVSSYSTPGGDTYTFDPAGRRIGLGDIQHYGIPSIDSVLNRAEYNAGTLAVA
jgi:hypothetical protein